ncbi:HAMP domain-containing sensor histidine kinase [Nocardiopsis sp. NPDC049922]|uniref:sensor histidine kinase n=1 Tax=Nocardiopsis sp. NPDC049922 TaxID=3155157 RepID=UPI0033C0D31E
MFRRLITLLLPAVFVLVAAVAVPIGGVIAQQRTQHVYVDLLADAGRFAALARTALETDRRDALAQEMARYEYLYGVPVAIVAPDGQVVGGSGSVERLEDVIAGVTTRTGITAAMAGARPEPPGAVWPWTSEPMVVAEPIGRDSEVVGVVVLVAPSERLASDVLTAWGWIALASLVPLALLTASVLPLSRWVLRPIRRLDAATTAMASGDLDVHVDAAGGPPELRRLTESFNTMVEVVRRALDRQRVFVSEASHQLRNPLASLRLAVENLAPHLSGPEAREAHEVAIDEATHMHRMLNSLLAATRLESVTGTETVELAEVLGTRVDRWRALCEARGFALVTDVPEGMWVQAPAGGLGSILDELVSNALRLSGGTRIEVRAEAERAGTGKGDRVRIGVFDDGVGLTEEERRSAVDRFWRSSRHQNVEGTGMGLAIVADLAREAGGELLLEEGLTAGDRPGFGAVLALPAASPE